MTTIAILNTSEIDYASPVEQAELNKSIGLTSEEFSSIKGEEVFCTGEYFSTINYQSVWKEKYANTELHFKLVDRARVDKDLFKKAVKFSPDVAKKLKIQ